MAESRELEKRFLAAIELVAAQNSLVDIVEGFKTLRIFLHNLVQNPKDPRFRKIRISNTEYQERLGHLTGGSGCLEVVGFKLSDDFLILDAEAFRDDQSELQKFLVHVDKAIASAEQDFDNPSHLPDDHDWKAVAHAVGHGEIGKRPTMEDAHMLVDNFCGVAGSGLFCLYDGHGGRNSVDFVVRSLHLNLERYLKSHPNTPMEEAFTATYRRTDAQVKRRNILQSGTTAVVALIRTEGSTRKLYISNAGDSRGVLCRDGTALRMTKDHKPADAEEAARVVADGGFIGCNRVNGILAISRALGDHLLKPAVSCDPHYMETDLEETDRFLIIACDGIWDVLSDQEAVDFVDCRADELINGPRQSEPEPSEDASTSPTPATSPTDVVPPSRREKWTKEQIRPHLKQIAIDLVQLALARHSLDNISVLLVWIGPSSSTGSGGKVD